MSLAPPPLLVGIGCCCALAVTTLLVFSVNSFVVVDINDAMFIMAVVDIVACIAIKCKNIPRVTCGRK